MEDLKQKVRDLMGSQNGKDVKTLLAYSIKKTESLKDDEIVKNADEIVGIIAENLEEVANQNPSDKEARDAAMRILKGIAKETDNKWDDRVIAIIDMFV